MAMSVQEVIDDRGTRKARISGRGVAVSERETLEDRYAKRWSSDLNFANW